MRWLCSTQAIRPCHVRRLVLRRAALRYAEHKWDVVPGACLVGTRFDCDQPGCLTVSCHPAVPHWEVVAGHDPFLIRSWWSELHRAVLLATGRAFDALEVPAALGALIVGSVQGPVAVAPSGRWLFLVRPGEGLRPELQGRLDVVLHGLGSWIPAPPSDHPGGRMRWETPPEEYEWQLPDPYAVQSLLLAGVPKLNSDRARRQSTRPVPLPLRGAA